MPRKCCVTGCNGNNGKLESKQTVFRLPADREERQRWINAIPRDNIPDGKDTVICERHFAPGYATVVVNGRKRPKYEPTVFSCVKPRLVPTCQPPRRKTTKASSDARNVLPDEMEMFLKQEQIPTFECLTSKMEGNEINFQVPVVKYSINDTMIIQSTTFESNSSITTFLLKIKNDLSYEGFHCGVACIISTLSRNRIRKLDTTSRVQEAIRYLSSLSKSNKKDVFLQEIDCMGWSLTHIGKKKYSAEIIARAFEYFATSRSLYQRLRDDYELPSVTTLTRLTSKVSAMNDREFLGEIFSNIEDRQKHCVLLIDEVYVKPSLLFHGGTVFGKAVNKPDHLANTVLSFMIVSLFGGPKFLYKMLPVYKLDSDFLFDQCNTILNGIKFVDGKCVAVICDNNRVNQSFFKKFELQKPYLTTDNLFLLFDYVHIMKSIRNNWITEKVQELEYKDGDQVKVAKWSHIVQLHNIEKDNLVKLSKLSEVTVSPKPIERQKVSICLQVFCDETIGALRTHSGMGTINADETVTFLEKIVKFWKVVNVRSLYGDIRSKDDRQKVVSSVNDNRLEFLLELAFMADEMKSSKQGNRIKQLTRDTARALSSTCRGLVELSKFLLGTSHQYVILRMYSTDPLEKMFGKLRQGSGGTYFINVQQVLEKFKIRKTKLLLEVGVDLENVNKEPGHSCQLCPYLLDENASEVFLNLAQLEERVPNDVKMALIDIAGYVIRNSESEYNDTTNYMLQYGDYLNEVNRGGLAIPGDSVCQWSIFCYILFHEIANKVCRKSLCNSLMMISEYYTLNIEKRHGIIMSSILLKNHCILFTPRSSKESKQKILKLST